MLLIGSLVGASLVGAVPATAATQPPAKWDPRVTKYVRFVEQHRKLEFEHPVPVKFLDDDAFVKAYQGDDPKITKAGPARGGAHRRPAARARARSRGRST